MSTKEKPEANTAKQTKKPRTRRQRREFPAKVKCEAVLSLWSERRKPAEISRELEIPYQQLMNWQDQAMAAMLERLEPRKRQVPPALGNRLQKLLEKTEKKALNSGKLSRRLESLSREKTP